MVERPVVISNSLSGSARGQNFVHLFGSGYFAGAGNRRDLAGQAFQAASYS